MTGIRPFQIILLGVFAAFALLGILFFMMFKASPEEEARGYGDRVIIWGTLERGAFDKTFLSIVDTEKDFQVVQYVEKDPRSFDYELLNAIAEGKSPDLIVLSSESLVLHRDKLLSIDFETMPERTYLNTYVDGAEIFMLTDGVYALPFAVDPLVMYWNRDLFSSNSLAAAPRTWEELSGVVVPNITKVTPSREITQSAIAFGTYQNIKNAKDILTLLFLQSGSTIVDEKDRNYTITLKQNNTNALPPAETALEFYTRFAAPLEPNYSWNPSLQDDTLAFTGGTLALYFGFGSEYAGILASNPNLNFDIAPVPQGKDATIKRGYGTFYGFAIPRAAGNPAASYRVAQRLVDPSAAPMLTEALSLAPVHRGVLGSGSTDPVRSILFNAALIARAWLDPNPEGTEAVFKSMIEDITSGRSRASKAVNDMVGKLQLLF